MITLKQDSEGNWIASCPHCPWRFSQKIHTITRHICPVSKETYTYVPEDWETRDAVGRNPALSKKVYGRLLEAEPEEEPGLLEKAGSFLKARQQHRAAGRPVLPPEKIAERFEICSSNRCGKFIALSEGKGKCRSCGCGLKKVEDWMAAFNKLSYATERCPKINPETNERYWDKIV